MTREHQLADQCNQRTEKICYTAQIARAIGAMHVPTVDNQKRGKNPRKLRLQKDRRSLTAGCTKNREKRAPPVVGKTEMMDGKGAINEVDRHQEQPPRTNHSRKIEDFKNLKMWVYRYAKPQHGKTMKGPPNRTIGAIWLKLTTKEGHKAASRP
ncbi:hypothetical protein TNCT_471121 [Trichonephila clavata]|uniref:Uncharacterized protein n=1 Tax=Trichonephila clavata TaxID=2740835 RepID=A0A8X6J242_TRICU|nr:hypothetical protein TNCT_471121 [Trichonephila clavata]